MKKNTLIVLGIAISFGLPGTVYADTLAGTVTSIDRGSNTMTLVPESANTTGPKEYKLSWDKNFVDIKKLEAVSVGQNLKVDAEQNIMTRGWKVKSLGELLAPYENAQLRAGDQKISGEITEIDREGRALTLRTDVKDDKGSFIQHHIVWDTSNETVLEKLKDVKIGDKLSLTADQNKMTRNWNVTSIS